MQSGDLATFGSVAVASVGTVGGITGLLKLLIAPLKTDIAALKDGQTIILNHVLSEK